MVFCLFLCNKSWYLFCFFVIWVGIFLVSLFYRWEKYSVSSRRVYQQSVKHSKVSRMTAVLSAQVGNLQITSLPLLHVCVSIDKSMKKERIDRFPLCFLFLSHFNQLKTHTDKNNFIFGFSPPSAPLWGVYWIACIHPV